MNKLLHIYSFESLELSRQHSDDARDLGFDVVRVGNDATLGSEQIEELLDLAVSDELQGVWLDLPFKKLTERSKDIARAAGHAGKLLLGRVPEAVDAKSLIVMYIGNSRLAEEATV